MIQHCRNIMFILAVLGGFLTAALPTYAAEKIWGSYENKIDGDKVSLSVFPVGADEKSGKASIIFDLIEKTGRDLEISGVGIVKGQSVTLYSRQYRLTVTVSEGKADFLVEESCGDHRFYEGYGHYSEKCELNKFKTLAKLSKGLTKK